MNSTAEAQRTAFLARFPDLAHTRNLLFLGRLHEKKGVDLFLRAFAQVRARQPHLVHNVRLVMAGPCEDDYGQRMQQLASSLGLDDVTVWTGMVSGPTKWGAFRVADAFVLPSHQENFGIAVAEALACGVPVLISNQVNIWREIEAAQAGVIDDDTVEGAMRQVQSWLAMPVAQREAMRADARACFLDNFHLERAASSLVSVVSSRVRGSVA